MTRTRRRLHALWLVMAAACLLWSGAQPGDLGGHDSRASYAIGATTSTATPAPTRHGGDRCHVRPIALVVLGAPGLAPPSAHPLGVQHRFVELGTQRQSSSRSSRGPPG